MNGIELIAAERQRQIDVEGWTAEHDADHDRGDLADAAHAYLHHAGKQIATGRIDVYPSKVPSIWPWENSWWKPSDDPIRNLEKAGALLAAQIDVLLRAKENANGLQ